MLPVRCSVAALALLPALLTPLAARADAAAGGRLARQWCASCHVIDGAGPGAVVPQGPPTFRAVTRRLDAAQLRTFLARPHPPMPDLALTRAEIEDLVAYMEGLMKQEDGRK